jgi:hypothetical protein
VGKRRDGSRKDCTAGTGTMVPLDTDFVNWGSIVAHSWLLVDKCGEFAWKLCQGLAKFRKRSLSCLKIACLRVFFSVGSSI